MRLVEYLFDRQGYNPLIRPVRNLTEKVAVKFGLAMIQLINVVRRMLEYFQNTRRLIFVNWEGDNVATYLRSVKVVAQPMIMWFQY